MFSCLRKRLHILLLHAKVLFQTGSLPGQQTSTSMRERLTDWSHHAPFSLELYTSSSKPPQTTWRLNASLLSHPTYREEISGHPCLVPFVTAKGEGKAPFTLTCAVGTV